jgi:hypothetical protein
MLGTNFSRCLLGAMEAKRTRAGLPDHKRKSPGKPSTCTGVRMDKLVLDQGRQESRVRWVGDCDEPKTRYWPTPVPESQQNGGKYHLSVSLE